MQADENAKPGNIPIAGPSHSRSRNPLGTTIPISAPATAHTAAQNTLTATAPPTDLIHAFAGTSRVP